MTAVMGHDPFVDENSSDWEAKGDHESLEEYLLEDTC
jgi:hypothetical protein